MHYYPIFPIEPLYPYPPLNPHLHAQLTAIHHSHLLRQQAELQYISRTNRQVANWERTSRYNNQILEKELEIARLLESDRAQLALQRQMIEQQSIREEIRFKEELWKLDRERQYLLARYPRPYLTDRKPEVQKQFLSQTLKEQPITLTGTNKQTAKFNSLHQGEVLNFKPKDNHISSQNNYTAESSDIASNKRRKVQSYAKDITYYEPSENFLKSSNKKGRYPILKNSQNNSPKLNKPKKVKFLKQSRRNMGSAHRESLEQNQKESYCLNNSAIRAAYGSSRKNPKGLASKRIQNRLKVSAVVFRDSQFRNTKHEVEHLTNTYDTECRLRRDLKTKINGRDEVIKKYNIVPPESK